MSTVIHYKINDVNKMTNSLQDSNTILRSICRGVLISITSKKDTYKIENEKTDLIQEFKVKILKIYLLNYFLSNF